MKTQTKIVLIVLLALALVISAGVGAVYAGSLLAPQAVPTAFTYQGHLRQAGELYTGSCDMQFGLYNALSGGSQVGSTISQANVPVTDGLFTVALDFGAGVFTGDPRWLEIAVRCPAGSGTYTTLTPRQALTSSPYATFAGGAPWEGLTNVPAGFADGTDDGTSYTAGTGLILDSFEFSLDEAYVGTVISETIINNPEWFSTIIISNTNLFSQTFQLTIEGVCPEGSAIRQVNADGSVTCEGDDNTTYTAGPGLILAGNEFSVDYVQVVTEILPTIITYTHPANLVIAAKSGGDFTTVQAAIDSITDASAGNPYTVLVAPGVYTESVVMQPYVSLVGVSQGSAILTAPGGSFPQATVTTAASAELSGLTIRNTGANPGNAIGIYVPPGANTVIHDVAVQAQGGQGSANSAIYVDAASPTIYNAALASMDHTSNYGVIIANGGAPSLTHSTISVTTSGAGLSTGIQISNNSSGSQISNVRIMAQGGPATGISVSGTTGITIYDTDIFASGSNTATGVYAGDSDVNLVGVNITASGGSVANYGVRALSTGVAYTIQIDQSTINAFTNTYYGDAEYTVYVGGSKLKGGAVNKNGGTSVCAGNYDEAFVFYASSCP